MKRKRPAFNKYERAIIKATALSRRPMSIKEIAEKSDTSWVTGRKYIRRLKDRGWLTSVAPRRVEFNYSLLGLKKKR